MHAVLQRNDFPKQARYGLPGFPELLLHIAKVHRNNRSELAAQGKQLGSALAAWQPEKGQGDISLMQRPSQRRCSNSSRLSTA